MSTKQKRQQKQKPRLATGQEMSTFYSRKTDFDARPKRVRTRKAQLDNAIKEYNA